MLSKSDFRDESKEDYQFNKDSECRREVLEVYNKKAADFDTLE